MKELLGMMDELFYKPAVTEVVTTSQPTTSTIEKTTSATTTSTVQTSTSTSTTSSTVESTTVFYSIKQFEILTSELEKSPLWDVELSSYQHFLDNSDGTRYD